MSPVAGLTDAGPLEPLQLPSVFAQITNQRSVSMALPGPTMSSHQPAESSTALLAACALGDSPVRISTALSRVAFNVPHVSYASRASRSSPPRFIGYGEGRAKYWRASAIAELRAGGVRKGSECGRHRQGHRSASAHRVGQSTLSIVSATGACVSVATSTGADSRSPVCGIALPLWLMRAATSTFANFDKVIAGVMAIASVSVTFAGKSDALRRATASGIGGPPTARANTNSVSPDFTLPTSLGSSLTVTVSATLARAVAADADVAGSAATSVASCVLLPMCASAAANSCCTAVATLEPGCSSGSKVFHCFAASA